MHHHSTRRQWGNDCGKHDDLRGDGWHIEVFATGGIGGVHHRRGTRFRYLSRFARISTHKCRCGQCGAGPKAILDLPLTMEYLETHGINTL